MDDNLVDYSGFDISASGLDGIDYSNWQPLDSEGATCDTFIGRYYGKLHFIKRLKKDLCANPLYRELFLKEFEIGFALDHPGLVRYVNIDIRSDVPYILTEFVDGATLGNFTAKNPDYFNSRGNALRFMTELLEAVGYMHSRQVLHLDLKPDNIMVTFTGFSVKLLDFGFSRDDAHDRTPGRTPVFAAPEQLKEGGKTDIRSDIYAIGGIMRFIRESCPSSRFSARGWRKLEALCLSEDPADRPENTDVLLASLRKAAAGKKRILFYGGGAVAALAIAVALVTGGNQGNVAERQKVADAPSDSIASIPPVPDNQEAISAPAASVPGETHDVADQGKMAAIPHRADVADYETLREQMDADIELRARDILMPVYKMGEHMLATDDFSYEYYLEYCDRISKDYRKALDNKDIREKYPQIREGDIVMDVAAYTASSIGSAVMKQMEAVGKKVEKLDMASKYYSEKADGNIRQSK